MYVKTLCTIFATFLKAKIISKWKHWKKYFTSSHYQLDDFYSHFVNIQLDTYKIEFVWIVLNFWTKWECESFGFIFFYFMLFFDRFFKESGFNIYNFTIFSCCLSFCSLEKLDKYHIHVQVLLHLKS